MKRVVVASFLTLVILGIITAGYIYFQRYSVATADPLNAIPSNAFFFVEANGGKDLLKKLSAENLLSSLTGSDSAGYSWEKLDSLLSAETDLKKTWEEKKIFLSAHLTRSNSFDYLLLFNMPPGWGNEKIYRFISRSFNIPAAPGKRIYENVQVDELEVSPGKNFSYAVTGGLFIGSFTSFLIDDAIRQLKSGTPVTRSKAFSRLLPSEDERGGAVLYLNYINLSEFLGAFSQNVSAPLLNRIGSFARWSRLSASIQNNALILHGLTTSLDTSDFISSLASQEPQRMDVPEILPARTAVFIDIGVSDCNRFFHHLFANTLYFDPVNKRQSVLQSLEKKFGKRLEKNMTGWVSNEITLAITEPGSTSFINNTYACIRAKDIESASASLSELQQSVNKNTVSKPEMYRKHPVSYINLTGLVSLFYSDLFSNISQFYYTTAGSYIVIANQAAALRNFIDDYEDNKTLSEDPGFKNTFRRADHSSGFFMYINPGRAKNILRHYLAEETGFIHPGNNTLNKFSSFTFQLSSRNGAAETTVQLLQTKDKTDNANLLWAAQLDTAVSMAPSILSNVQNNSKCILVQDENKTLYLLDDAGNVSWKKKLPEKILSSFHVVDAYKNGQQQILFNTASQLYLMDLSGNDYGNYPIRLPAEATNGVEVTDPDHSKNYKLFIACRNRMVYAYEISGKPMNGWLFNYPVTDVTMPVQYFHSGEKDFLLIHNTHGAVFLLDQKGAVRVALKQFYVGRNSTFSFVHGDSLAPDHLVTTDTTGKVLSLFFNGTVKSKSYGLMSADHAFMAADVDGDGREDYIFLDHHQLNIFHSDSSLVYYHLFTENMLPEIYSFPLSPLTRELGFSSCESDRFFMLNPDGHVSNGFPVKGCRCSRSDGAGAEEKRLLVTSGADGNIYSYILE